MTDAPMQAHVFQADANGRCITCNWSGDYDHLPATPRTAAGREFIERQGTAKTREVIAIEAEAANALLAALRALVEHWEVGWESDEAWVRDFEQARALLRDLSGEEEGQ